MLVDEPAEATDVTVKLHDSHYRSCLLSRDDFQDLLGNRYRDVDLKGVGNLDYDITTNRLILRPLNDKGERKFNVVGPWGLVDIGYAITDRDMSEKFIKLGIRTYRVLAILELLELINQGKRLSLPDARAMGIIEAEVIPAQSVRAYRTKLRIENVLDVSAPDIGCMYIEDTIQLMSNEFHLPDLTPRSYLPLFTKLLAESLGRIHAAGYVHCCMDQHNVTLDARIVDLDSVKTMKEVHGKFAWHVNDDKTKAFFVIAGLSAAVRDLFSLGGRIPKLKDLFEETYYKSYGF